MGTSAFVAALIYLHFTVSRAHVPWTCNQGNCGGGIVCPTGYAVSGSSCVVSQGTSTGCVGSSCSGCTGSSCSGCTGGSCTTTCPVGYYAHQNQCLKYTCPQNHVFMGGSCHHMAQGCTQTCQQGYVLLANMCHMQSVVPCAPQSCTSTSSCQHTCYSGQQCCSSQIVVPPKIICPPVTPPPTTTYYPPVTTERMCRNNTIYIQGNCTDVSCPRETKWDGQKCVSMNTLSHNSSVDIKHFINNVNTINSPTNVNIKNDNNVYVYTADERKIDITSKDKKDCDKTTSTCTTVVVTPAPTTPGPTTPRQPCCIVVAPRVCSQSHASTKWICYNRKYSRCGSFCTHPKIYLKPMRPIQRHHYMVVPPPIPCTGHNCGGPGGCSGCSSGGYCGSHCEQYVDHRDCSGCASGGHCSSYCQDYSCGSSCQFTEQQHYCQESHGQLGCSEYDGCYEDWCSK